MTMIESVGEWWRRDHSIMYVPVHEDEKKSFISESSEAPKMPRKLPWSISMITGSIFVLPWLLLGITIITTLHGPRRSDGLVYSPANAVITYEARTIDTRLHATNPYNGPPNDASDFAWHRLLRNTNVKVGKDTLDKINKTSVSVSDGSGYFVIPDVYHQLHCLKSIRQWIYRDYYGQEEGPMTLPHLDHCIDNLRQNVMCKGDMTLLTFDWLDWTPTPKPLFLQEHECVNWASIDGWAEDNAIDIFNPKTILHPTLGPAYLDEIRNGHTGIVVHNFSEDGPP